MRYPVLHCDRLGTKYGDAVRLTFREEADDNIVRAFLPCHYGAAVTVDELAAINNERIIYILT